MITTKQKFYEKMLANQKIICCCFFEHSIYNWYIQIYKNKDNYKLRAVKKMGSTGEILGVLQRNNFGYWERHTSFTNWNTNGWIPIKFHDLKISEEVRNNIFINLQ